MAYGKGSAGSPLDLCQFYLLLSRPPGDLSPLIPPIVACSLPESARPLERSGGASTLYPLPVKMSLVHWKRQLNYSGYSSRCTGIPNRSVVSLWPGCTRSTLSGLHTLSFSRLACNLFPVTSSKKGATAAYETICLWIVPIPPPLSHIPNNPCLRPPLGLSLSF